MALSPEDDQENGMKNFEILLLALLSVGSMVQTAPHIFKGEDYQNGEAYRLQVVEMDLPEGKRVQKNGFKWLPAQYRRA